MPDALSIRECMHRSEGQFEGRLHGAVPGSGDGCFHAASSAIACRDRRRQGDPRSIIVTALSSSPSSLSPSIRPYPPNWSPLICDNLATQRPQPSTNGSLNTAAFTCTSPGPAPPGSTRWNAGSVFSPTNCSATASPKRCRTGDDVRDWINAWNDNPRPFRWTKTVEEMLDSLAKYIARISGGGYQAEDTRREHAKSMQTPVRHHRTVRLLRLRRHAASIPARGARQSWLQTCRADDRWRWRRR